MASIGDERADSILEGHRTSLLDIIEERNRTLNKKTLLHRVAIVSRMYHQNHTEIAQYYEKFFRDIQNLHQVEGVTGLLLLFPKHCIHVVETSTDVVQELVRDLVAQEKDQSSHMECSKILVISHNIPHRLYQHWSHRVLDIEAPRSGSYEPNEEPEQLVGDMLTQLLKLGTHLARQPKVSQKSAMDALHENKPELLPQQDVLQYLLEKDTIDCIMTPADFMDMCDKPFDVVLDSVGLANAATFVSIQLKDTTRDAVIS